MNPLGCLFLGWFCENPRIFLCGDGLKTQGIHLGVVLRVKGFHFVRVVLQTVRGSCWGGTSFWHMLFIFAYFPGYLA